MQKWAIQWNRASLAGLYWIAVEFVITFEADGDLANQLFADAQKVRSAIPAIRQNDHPTMLLGNCLTLSSLVA
ncbi:hypothetical protein KDW_38550 [Dictyobacter vulcani]|uniref:Uncharacterized protein n=1 Tax=Dictyobacter vulcani TaxID=2607529 RepID=A0A5J4KQ23_9CHLR|nr:hypothetical protein KDW_38550 [Dictyobacter vulcani]